MRVLLLLSLICACALALPTKNEVSVIEKTDIEITEHERNFIVNGLISQAINILRLFINNGSPALGIPPLDPFVLDHLHLDLPLGLVNLDLEIVEGLATGFGGFVMRRNALTFRPDLVLDLQFSFPLIHISAAKYDLVGNLFNAIPLFGKGEALFELEALSISAKAYLKQSEDGKSIIIDRIQDAFFELPAIRSGLTGVIGGGNIDQVVNSIISDVVGSYVNRFNGAIAKVFADNIVKIANPILEQLDTWKYIALWV